MATLLSSIILPVFQKKGWLHIWQTSLCFHTGFGFRVLVISQTTMVDSSELSSAFAGL